MYLKDVSRIQALLCVYFFVLLIEGAAGARAVRRAMDREEIDSLPLYPRVARAAVPRHGHDRPV